MNVPLFLGITFVVCAVGFVWLIRSSAKDLGKGKQKLTKEQKILKRLGAKG